MRDKYYKRDGTLYTGKNVMMQWAKDHSNKRVALTEINPGVSVSTVWLGLNHNWGDGPPLIFETMIFGGPDDQDMLRYSTEAEALKGHKRMVRKQKKKLKLK